MKIEQAIRTLLIEDETIAGLVKRRVRPLNLAQNDVRPHLTYSVEVQTIPTFGGVCTYRRATLNVSSVADTHIDCTQLADEVRRLLDGYASDVGAVRIEPCLLEDETEPAQGVDPGTEKPVYVQTQTYRILFKETA